MRLTLRTMLAYLDDILEPADRDDIAKKIADSPFAGHLLERIRECSRSPRLPAPKLMGRGMGLDPNTVAEYLDNTLAGERVPEFETVCLPPPENPPQAVESDVFLAEVASCHQILTMVLGQPAQVDPEMKRRMYGIIEQASKSAHAPEPTEYQLAPDADGLATDALHDFEIKPRRERPQVPDYLRQPAARTKWKPILAASILALLLIGAISMALGPLDHHHPLWGWMFSDQAGQNQVAANTAGTEKTNPDQTKEAPTEPATGDVAGKPAGTDATMPAATAPAAADSTGQTPPAAGQTNPAVTPPPSVPNPTDVAGTPAGATVPSVATNNVPPDRPAPATGDVAAGAAPTTMPADATRPMPIVPPQGNTPAGNATAGTNTTVDNPAASTTEPPPQPVPAVEEKPIGRFLPAKDVVLLRFDNLTKQWLRLSSARGAPLVGGDQLLVLPNYRPTLILTAGITLQIPPETLLQLEPLSPTGVPGIKLQYGRLVAMTTGKVGSELHLDLGVASGTVTFVDADATLAVDVRRTLPPGVNPEVGDPVTTVDLYADNGQIQWTAADGSIATLKAPQRWSLPSNPPDNGAAGASAQVIMPKWIRPESLNPNDARCAELLAGDLESNKPLLIALREMATRKEVEQHAFAAQCLAQLDEFEPLISAFNDADRKSKWPMEIASVKSALTRGPATAGLVREAFQKQRGEEQGKELYRMLLGYTKDQLQGGEATRLVDALDSDSLDYRVLGFAALQEITNKTHYYRPDTASPTARAQPVKLWREDLRTGGIVPREPAAAKQ